MENWNELLKQARMDQKDLAIALDKSPSVISALVNNVSGKAAAGKKLKLKALDYLNARIKGSESVVSGRSKSELSGIELSDDGGQNVHDELRLWKKRANEAEGKLHQLRTALRSLLQLSGTGASSDPDAEDLREALDEAEKEG